MEQKGAAIFRLEGVLSPRPTLTAAAWLASNSRRMRDRLFGLSGVLLAAPLSLRDPGLARERAWAQLRGMSEDRLVVLSEQYAEEHLLGHLSELGLSLLERCRDRGLVLVLVSDAVEAIARPVADALGVEHLLCNAMEIERGSCTGALREPRIGAEISPDRLRALASRVGVDLARSRAYGSSEADAMMLGAVGLPCAVDPEPGLRRLARDMSWPVTDPREAA